MATKCNVVSTSCIVPQSTYYNFIMLGNNVWVRFSSFCENPLIMQDSLFRNHSQ